MTKRPYAAGLASLPLLFGLAACGSPPAPTHSPKAAPKPGQTQAVTLPVAPTSDDVFVYHGIRVPDPYAWMEKGGDRLDRWLREADSESRAHLASLPRRSDFLELLEQDRASRTIVESMAVRGNLAFFQKELAGDNVPSLHVYDLTTGESREIYRPSTSSDEHIDIDHFEPSPDGQLVAFGVSRNGTEDSDLFVIRTKDGVQVDGPIPHTQYADVSWEPDGQAFYYWRMDLPPEVVARGPYENMRTYRHELGGDYREDRAVFGYGVVDTIETHDFPSVRASHEAGGWALGIAPDGTGREYKVYAARLSDLRKNQLTWTQVFDRSDRVASFVVRGNDLYALSRRDSDDASLIHVDLGSKRQRQRLLLPAGDLNLFRLRLGSDALYVVARKDARNTVYRVEFDGSTWNRLPTPEGSHVESVAAAPGTPHLLIEYQRWGESSQFASYQSGRELAPIPVTEDSQESHPLVVHLEHVKADDGAFIPLTIIHRVGLKLTATTPAKLIGYGSYGSIYRPAHFASERSWVDLGGVLAYAHVRGGGANGYAWHQAGRRAQKQRAVDDFIACAEFLVERGYTSPAHLAAKGKSAGGVLVGAAITQRPALFRAAAIDVGAVNMIRFETTIGGPANIAEYGTVTDENEFHALHQLDPYSSVRKGTQYPAMFLTGGVNDIRVPVWQPAKFAARLRASGTKRPVLLRVEFNDGHWSDRKSYNEARAEENAFLRSQFGPR